ncbi:MAG TPA: inositol monophosphatase family protein [Gemmatimonadaceae bacterium]|nr:inositol monophosphatase family protein [Gemmatimonadaceae bacterium]
MQLIAHWVNDLLEVAAAAGDLALELRPKSRASAKRGPAGVVTEADVAVETLIRRELQQRFPRATIVSEETGPLTPPGPLTFYVDPIDGTVNYYHGLPYCSVSIAARSVDCTVAAVVHDIVGRVSYVAEAGQPPFLIRRDQHSIASATPIQVSETQQLRDALLITGFSPDEHGEARRSARFLPVVLGMCEDVRRFGAASLDLATVAIGRADGYWETSVGGLWDVLAGAFLVAQAGGRSLVYHDQATGRAAALSSNAAIHAELAKATEAQFAGYDLFEAMGAA